MLAKEIIQVIYIFLSMSELRSKQLVLLFFLFIATLLIIQSCAQMASPPGGKKDTLAPKLITSIPLNKSKNYKGTKLELSFNEFINVRNLNQELLITPNIGTYQTRIRPNGLSILLDSALKDQTTYTFNFRNSIEDMSERNIGKNIKLVFSTSNTIDSLSITGKIKSVEQNKAFENILVGLYPYNDTLRIDKAKPYYFTKTDTSGIYTLENLAEGNYYMAAFIDGNNNLLYNSNKEPVDFLKEPFFTLNKNETKNFYISLQNQDPLKITKITSTAKTVLYEMSRGIKALELDNKKDLIYQIEGNKNIRIYVKNQEAKDTLFLSANLTDSLNRNYKIPLKVKFRELNKKEKITQIPLQVSYLPTQGKYVSPEDSLVLNFPKPVVSWDSKRVQFKTEENETITLPDEAYMWNKYSNQLTIKRSFLPYREKFLLNLEKGAFVSVENDSSEVQKQTFQFQDLEEYGSIEGKVGDRANNYVVQLLNAANMQVIYEQNTSQKFNFLHVEPGVYIIRAIEDKNKNGYKDIGNFLLKTKPESVFYLEGKVKLKANFQITDLLISTQN
jgi:uncharacterized protein (DUF2141 family)